MLSQLLVRVFWMQNQMKGRVILVTGSTDGIGKETAMELAKKGGLTCSCTKETVRRVVGL